MTDENAERIRDLELRIAQWGSEHEHAMQEQRDAQYSLKTTLSLSSRITIFGSIPSVVWILGWISVTGIGQPIVNQIMLFCAVLILFGAISAGGARGSGLVAHWWFQNSVVREQLACVVIALLSQAVLFGWVVVFFRFRWEMIFWASS